MDVHNKKTELSRPLLFKSIITVEAEKDAALQQPVINMRDAAGVLNKHRRLMVEAEHYVFGTKDKGKKI